MTKATWDIVGPTIREDDAEVWFTWNPLNRTDWVWQRFRVNPQPYDVVATGINYYLNPWLTKFSSVADRGDAPHQPGECIAGCGSGSRTTQAPTGASSRTRSSPTAMDAFDAGLMPEGWEGGAAARRVRRGGHRR